MRSIVLIVSGLALWGSVLAAAPARAQAETPPAPAAASYRVALAYEHTRFDADLEPWHLASVELSRRGAAGSLILRGNAATRFEESGRQVEVEAYPRLGSGAYAYLGAGVSADGLFPDFRYGAELFVSPASGVELSAGLRHLDFPDTKVTLYTGSAGWYRGNYYLVARPFVASKEEGTSLSGTALVRRYYRDADEYLGLRLGAGATPAEEYTTAELTRLGSWRAALEGKRPLGGGTHLRGSAGYEREETADGGERGRIMVGVGLEKSF